MRRVYTQKYSRKFTGLFVVIRVKRKQRLCHPEEAMRTKDLAESHADVFRSHTESTENTKLAALLRSQLSAMLPSVFIPEASTSGASA